MASSAVLEIRRDTRPAARFAWIVLGFFVLVVLWGAVVRASGSGGGCGANWPLCNGDFVPHHPRLATVIEFTHRSTSGICTFLLATLALWTFAITPRNHRARRAVLWSIALLIVEAFLGAVLVLRHYVEDNISPGRVIAQSIHFTNTMLLMAALALTAWFLQQPRAHAIPATAPRPRAAAILAILAILATILVGATGSLAALADTLFPSPTLLAGLHADFAANSPLLLRMRWVHPAATILASICVLLLIHAEKLSAEKIHVGSRSYTSAESSNTNAEKSNTNAEKSYAEKPFHPFHGLTGLVLASLVLQFVLGIADVLLLAPTWMQVLHLLGADLYWIALVVLAAKSLWPPQPATSPL